ncbi:hypothetical protein AAG906_027222 [Vitis piasezkii]
MLYFGRWPTYVLNRTNILLSFVESTRSRDFCHHLIEETILAEGTTRVDVPIQPTHEATTEPSSSYDPSSSLYPIIFTYYISRHNYLF